MPSELERQAEVVVQLEELLERAAEEAESEPMTLSFPANEPNSGVPPNLFWISLEPNIAETLRGESSAQAALSRVIELIREGIPTALREEFEASLAQGYVNMIDGRVVEQSVQGAAAFADALCKTFYPILRFKAQFFCYRDFALRC